MEAEVLVAAIPPIVDAGALRHQLRAAHVRFAAAVLEVGMQRERPGVVVLQGMRIRHADGFRDYLGQHGIAADAVFGRLPGRMPARR
ncbi:MAG: hypothetical protein ACXWKH_18815 [Limisphaerales bacterium]